MSVGHSIIRGIPLSSAGIQLAGQDSLIMSDANFSVCAFKLKPGETVHPISHHKLGHVYVAVCASGGVALSLDYHMDDSMALTAGFAVCDCILRKFTGGPNGALVVVISFPNDYAKGKIEMPQTMNVRPNPWFLQQLAPNTIVEAALGFHGPDYTNSAHYQKTQEEVIFLLSGKARYGRHLLAATEDTCDAIVSPPFVADDEYTEGEIIQFVIKTPFGGRGDKVIVGSDEDLALRASGVRVIEYD
jgi:hypothetical protein